MDSPVFGKPTAKAPSFRRSSPENITPMKDTQYALALLLLTKNIRQLFTAAKRLEQKQKRMAFLAISSNQHRPRRFVAQRELICSLEVERRLQTISHIVNRNILKSKIEGWRAMRGKTIAEAEGQRKSSTLPKERRPQLKRTEEWKENSTCNVLDLSSENKRLKLEISREEAESENFIEKMNALLDMHDKAKAPGRKRK